MKRRVTVTGGTGFVGRHLCRKLVESGYAVTVLTRSPERTRGKLPDCELVRWNGRELLPQEALRDCHALIHLAGEPIAAKRWTKKIKTKIRQSRVEGTDWIAKSLASHPMPVLISASAVGFYGDAGETTLEETSPPGNDFLAEVCQEWEAAALRCRVERQVILRFGMVLGIDGGALPKMLPAFRLGAGAVIGNGRQWMSWIHVADLVRLFLFALEQDVRGTFNAVSHHPVRNEDFTRALAYALHRPVFLSAPAFVLRAALGEMATVLLGSQRAVPAQALRAGFSFEHPELDEALGNLLTTPKT